MKVRHFFVLILLALFSLDCSKKEAEWEASEQQARIFLDALRDGKYAQAHTMFKEGVGWGMKPEIEFIGFLQANEASGALNFDYELEAYSSDPRAGWYSFLVHKTWKKGIDASKLSEPVAGFSPTSELTLQKSKGKWKVLSYQIHRRFNIGLQKE